MSSNGVQVELVKKKDASRDMTGANDIPLPAYEARASSFGTALHRPSSNLETDANSSSIPPQPVQPHANSPLPSANPDIDTTSFFGGGGVRIPLSVVEKEREDLRNLSHLAAFGIQVWVRGFDEQYEWDPCASYKAAAAQLDILLPLLSPSNGQLAATTALRTITIRLPDLPTADLGYHCVREGREEISRALSTWLMKPTVEAASMWSFADTLIRRIRNEGFVVNEEWWEFNGGFVQFVVRC
ncbi:hypothetical protein BU17DRAFT_71220 [Hysterangium stoloniferum]|nr:hypothetical protein BU17DRAFT_71220 [Hysterangium stoloniferum]